MIRRAFRKTPLPPSYLRVVQHDRPEMLRQHPNIERELALREHIRKACALAAAVSVLGLSVAIAAGLAALARALGR